MEVSRRVEADLRERDVVFPARAGLDVVEHERAGSVASARAPAATSEPRLKRVSLDLSTSANTALHGSVPSRSSGSGTTARAAEPSLAMPIHPGAPLARRASTSKGGGRSARSPLGAPRWPEAQASVEHTRSTDSQ